MKHFVVYLIIVFAGLSFFYYNRGDQAKNFEDKKIHVYASSSFVAKWGPGPQLKELFEKQNIFKIEFIEIPDVAMALQKISFEGENSMADVVLGLDQFDLTRLANKVKWLEIDRDSAINFVGPISSVSTNPNFLPYDWAPMTFVARKNLKANINSLKDLLNPELKGKISLQDPRTSSPGLQFLIWVFESYPADEAIRLLKGIKEQAHSFSPSWSASYGLFKNQQTDLVFSYVTSPVYHSVEEKDDQFFSVETQEALPIQVEFAGIPASCKNCEAAEMFVNFLTSQEAQKVIMSKNYMLPVLDHVKEATPFDAIKVYKTRPVKYYDQSKIEKWINVWSEIRKNEDR